MAVAGLVFGILGITIFCWAGPLLGVAWATMSSGAGFLTGQPEVSTWQIWALGLGVGVALPLVAVGLSIGGFVQGKSKGVAIGGLVTGAIAAIGGLSLTVFLAFWGNLAKEEATKQIGAGAQQNADYQQMLNTLDDPAFQDQMKQLMDQAAQMQGGAPPAGQPANAPPTPTVQPMQQQIPVQPVQPQVPGQPALPAEAPPQPQAPAPAPAQ